MPPSFVAIRTGGRDVLLAIPPVWRVALLRLGFVWLALVLLFHADWAAMARQWWDISTYNHILLIPAILVWLVAQRARELVAIEPHAWWPGLVLAAGAAFVWLLGAFSGVDLARQLGAVLLLIFAVPTMLGPRVSWGLFFPLAYMLLLVPFGDEMVPPLQMITAAITVALVDLSGIPAVVNGVFIDTPAGLFEVAEACSGVKFLIAMLAFGLLVANVCFLSWRRRVVLLVASLIVPILANGVRAWGTIYAAQVFGIEAAAGFDHIVYGWIFFAIVLSLVMAGAWRFFDRPADDRFIEAGRINRSLLLDRLAAMRIAPRVALATLLVIAIAVQGWARTASGASADLPKQLFLPEVSGWQQADYEPLFWWEPRAGGAEHRLLGRYTDGSGLAVDVFLAVYAGQDDQRDAGGFGEGAVMPDLSWAWLSPGRSLEGAKADRMLANGTVERLALTWYRTGDLTTGSIARLKLANMADRLLFRAQPTMMLILSAEERPGQPAARAIQAFRAAAGPLDEWMDRVAGIQ